ncbi:ubx domain-containing protein [Stemphylium lycopersici]|nr:ubx domain-containing protein [Stemphylium lycopersici]
MSHVVVFNSHARTHKIPTTPVKYLTEVRDEACQKFGVSKDQYTLKYNNKPISLSQQIRLANLPQGARLELVQASRSPTVISVALQLPASEKNVRLTNKFASNTSLWEILRHFESGQGANYNFTQRGVPEMSGGSGAGRLHYEQPVITVMPGHKEQSSFVELQQTLSQLGFDSGSALLKLSYRNSATPMEEAMAQITQYFKSDEPSAGAEGAHASTSDQLSSIPDPAQAAPEATATLAGETVRNDEPDPEPMDVDSKPAAQPVQEPDVSTKNYAAENTENTSPAAALAAATSTASAPVEPAQHPPQPTEEPSQPAGRLRTVQIFSAPTSSTPQAARNAFNESDYLPTIEHAKAHQNALLNKTKNTRLLSDKELEEQEKERQAKIDAAAEKGGSLRIRMPDGALIQMPFDKTYTASGLYDTVRGFLEKKNEPFQLKNTGPTGRLALIPQDNKRLVQDLRFFNNELVTFQWADNASPEVRASRRALAPEWQAKAQTLKVEEPVREEKAQPQATPGQSVADGKRKANMSNEEKEKAASRQMLTRVTMEDVVFVRSVSRQRGQKNSPGTTVKKRSSPKNVTNKATTARATKQSSNTPAKRTLPKEVLEWLSTPSNSSFNDHVARKSIQAPIQLSASNATPIPPQDETFMLATRRALEQAIGKEALERHEEFLAQEKKSVEDYISKLEEAGRQKYEGGPAMQSALVRDQIAMFKARVEGQDEATKTEIRLQREWNQTLAKDRVVLVEEKAALEAKLEEIGKKNEALKTEMAKLRDETRNPEQDEGTRNEIVLLRTQNAKLQEVKTVLERNVEGMKGETATLKAQISTLERTLQEQKRLHETKEKRRADEKPKGASTKAVRAFSKKFKESKRGNVALTEQNTALAIQVAKLEAKLIAALSRPQPRTSQHQQQHAESLAAKDAQITQLQTQLSKLSQQICQSSDATDETKSRNKLKRERRLTKKANTLLQKRVDDMAQNYHKLQAKNGVLVTKLLGVAQAAGFVGGEGREGERTWVEEVEGLKGWPLEDDEVLKMEIE